MTKGSTLELSRTGTIPVSIKTPEGVRVIDVTTYRIAGPGSDTVQHGMSLGYTELQAGHIRIDGVCPESDDLARAAGPMKSISLVKP